MTACGAGGTLIVESNGPQTVLHPARLRFYGERLAKRDRSTENRREEHSGRAWRRLYCSKL